MISVTGTKRIQRRLDSWTARIRDKRKPATFLQQELKRTSPFLTGRLRRSIRVRIVRAGWRIMMLYYGVYQNPRWFRRAYRNFRRRLFRHYKI